MNMKPRHLFFAALALLTCHVGQAKETSVDVNTLSAAFDQAADQDILLLESGTYSGRLTFPNGKTLTLKAAPGADVVFAGTFTGNESDSDGGIILDGLDIVTGENYFIDMAYGNVKTIAVRNSSISGYRALLPSHQQCRESHRRHRIYQLHHQRLRSQRLLFSLPPAWRKIDLGKKLYPQKLHLGARAFSVPRIRLPTSH